MHTHTHTHTQFTNSLASSIIFVQYNKTVAPKEVEQGKENFNAIQILTVVCFPWLYNIDSRSLRIDTKPLPETFYQHGILDILNVVFYALVWIIIHALLQEYIWEVLCGSFINCALGHSLVYFSALSSVFVYPR